MGAVDGSRSRVSEGLRICFKSFCCAGRLNSPSFDNKRALTNNYSREPVIVSYGKYDVRNP